MGRTLIPAVLITLLLGSSAASAQTAPGTPDSKTRRTTLWTVVGAGAGFGVGIWAGLHVFDDSINSDRKVWTTAIISAAAGGILGHLTSRGRSRSDMRRAGKARGIEPLTSRVLPDGVLRLREGSVALPVPLALPPSGTAPQLDAHETAASCRSSNCSPGVHAWLASPWRPDCRHLRLAPVPALLELPFDPLAVERLHRDCPGERNRLRDVADSLVAPAPVVDGTPSAPQQPGAGKASRVHSSSASTDPRSPEACRRSSY
jgi:hypothetical protein